MVVCAAHVNLYSLVLSRLVITVLRIVLSSPEYFHTHLGLAAAGTFSTKYLDTNCNRAQTIPANKLAEISK